MHAVAEGKNPQPIVSGQQQRRETAVVHAAHGKEHQPAGNGQDHEPAHRVPADPEQRLMFQRLPVAAHGGDPVERVDGRIRVAGHGAGVFFQQRGDQVPYAKEGQPHGQRRQQRQGRPAKAAPQRAETVRLLHNGSQETGRQHRPEEQGLGFDGQRHTVEEGRRQVTPLFQQQEAQQQRQRKGAVDLLPDAGIEQRKRVERRECRQQQRGRAGHAVRRHPPDQPGGGCVAERGRQRQQQVGERRFIGK